MLLLVSCHLLACCSLVSLTHSQGLTIGIVIIPQAMAYALLARLSPEFGLYTSFTGAVLYWLFGTSKDIVIGVSICRGLGQQSYPIILIQLLCLSQTTAVGSLLVGTVVTKVDEQMPGVYTHEEAAKALSVIAGAILLVLGICRMGWIIEFIPYVPISAFVTAASITIMSTQLPVALGITGINTREAPYQVLINTMKALPRTKLDASIGLTSIALLFFVKYVCATMEVRQPSRKRMWATISSLRLTFAMILFTFISWLVHRNIPKGVTKFRLVGVIQSGECGIRVCIYESKPIIIPVRFQTCWSTYTRRGPTSHDHAAAPCNCHYTHHRAHRYCKVFRESIWLYRYNISRDVCPRSSQRLQSICRWLCMHWFLQCIRSSVQSRSSHSTGWLVQRLHPNLGAVCFNVGILLHPYGRSCRLDHPRSEQFGNIAAELVQVLAIVSI